MYKALLKPILFRMEAESAHERVLGISKAVSGNDFLKFWAGLIFKFHSSKLTQNFWGLQFDNPIGLAAGFDKNGHIPELIEAAGLGFSEIGSITANPNTGNPKPRLFRLPEDRSLINRMGLNNDGAKTIVKRLLNKSPAIPLGINIAKTHDPSILGDRALRDYQFSYKEAEKIADYITVNISCPNTEEGMTFENPDALDELLSALKIKDDARSVPTLVKFSVDIDRERLESLLDICEQHRIHGYVATNTSTDRSNLRTDQKLIQQIGKGGVSGKAIQHKSTRVIRWIYSRIKGRKPIIGVGGIDSFGSALNKLKAGADLLQIYTGFIYEGPRLAKKINKKLVKYLNKNGLKSLHQLPRTKESTNSE